MAEYRIYRKGEKVALPLSVVDHELCEHFGDVERPEDFSNTYNALIGWMFVGFVRSNSWGFEKALKTAIRVYKQEYAEDIGTRRDMVPILSWFGEHYTMNAYRK